MSKSGVSCGPGGPGCPQSTYNITSGAIFIPIDRADGIAFHVPKFIVLLGDVHSSSLCQSCHLFRLRLDLSAVLDTIGRLIDIDALSHTPCELARTVINADEFVH